MFDFCRGLVVFFFLLGHFFFFFSRAAGEIKKRKEEITSTVQEKKAKTFLSRKNAKNEKKMPVPSWAVPVLGRP